MEDLRCINEENERLAARYGVNYAFVKTYADAVEMHPEFSAEDIAKVMDVVYETVKDIEGSNILILHGRESFVNTVKKKHHHAASKVGSLPKDEPQGMVCRLSWRDLFQHENFLSGRIYMSDIFETESKIKQIIDELKALSAQVGLTNQGEEERIITSVFLYKFLNDKFMYNLSKFAEEIGETIEEILKNENDELDAFYDTTSGDVAFGYEDSIVSIALPASIVNKFEKIAGQLDKRLEEAERENEELTSLRDFLLPMLMNGQVKVRGA